MTGPIKIPKLVVLTGMPRAGKSTFALRLRDEGYTHVCSDNFREGLYGIREHGKTSDAQEDVIFSSMKHAAMRSLGYGLDTVVDATMGVEGYRQPFLDTRYDAKDGVAELLAEKYLVWLRTPLDVLEQRAIESGRTLDGLRYVQSYWTDPVPGEGYELITYDGGSAADEFLERIAK